MSETTHPTSISEKEVTKVAHLARLRLDEQNIVSYTRSLCNILDLIVEINNSDTSTVEPMSSPLENSLPKRADKVTAVNQRELLQDLAPQVSSGLYIVPQVIE